MRANSTKMAKLVKLMSFYAWIWNKMQGNFVILFHYAATNRKLDGNWKISANVIHFLLNFVGMVALPVIYGIFSLSSHFFKLRVRIRLYRGAKCSTF